MTTNQGRTLEQERQRREVALDDLEAAEYAVYEQVAVMWAQGWPGGRVPFSGPGEVHLCFEDGRTIVCRRRRRPPPEPPTVVEADS